jgi:hypothetical protein
MQYENIVKLVLEFAATFKVADMNDPDEIQGAEGLFAYYCVEKFTAEEKELICRIAAEETSKLKEKLRLEFSSPPPLNDPHYAYRRQVVEKEIAFYEKMPDTVYYFERYLE